jgi:hypothetical protein
MKKFVLVLSIVLVLCLALAVPAAAAGPHSKIWYLFDTTMNNSLGTPQLYMSTTGSPTGEVMISPGATKMWISDKVALANVTFPNDAWTIRFGTDMDWGPGNFVAEIGYWNGTIFTVLPMVGTPVFYANHYEMQFKAVPSIGQTIPVNTYLAVTVFNNSPAGTNGLAGIHPIYTGTWLPDRTGSQYFSCLTSPQSDPGYPLPELGAGILLAAGILGLGGFIIVHRRKAVHSG